MAILKDLSTEFLGLVDTVVTAVVVDVDVVRPSELFEVTLGGNSLFAIGMFLMAAVDEFGKAINEDGGTCIAAFAALASAEGNESSYG